MFEPTLPFLTLMMICVTVRIADVSVFTCYFAKILETELVHPKQKPTTEERQNVKQ